MFTEKVDVYVISLDKTFNTKQLVKLLPNSEVHVQTGVDIRKASLKNIYNAGIIGQAGYDSISEGRKRHSELNSIGGVGLAFANRFAMVKNVASPLLLLEDDFVINSEDKLVNELTSLHSHIDSFDIAVFGAQYKGNQNDLEPVPFMPKGWYYMFKDRFFATHCVFYSPKGREKVSSFLANEPMDMQIDSLYAFWAETKGLRIILQIEDPTVVQKWHISSIQTDTCVLCDIPPSHNKYTQFYKSVIFWKIMVFVLVLVILVLVCCIHSQRGKQS